MSKQKSVMPVLPHILGLISGFLGPLIILLVSKEKEVKLNSKIVLNWQFSLAIYMFVSLILSLFLVGLFFIFALGILNLVFSIIGAIKASEGKLWKYPLSIRFFKI
jgi:uncharacterized Tic20 family protein